MAHLLQSSARDRDGFLEEVGCPRVHIVTVTVFQWSNYMDVQIQMSKAPGQDGVCGNFNSNFGDDSTQAIMKRIGARVPAGHSLFSSQAVVEFTHQMAKMMAAECGASQLSQGKGMCVKLGLGGNVLKACEYDWCFGDFVRARSHAKTYA